MRSPPNVADAVSLSFESPALPLPNTSPTLLEIDVSSLERNVFSPAPGSSAFCFFIGLPTNSPFNAFVAVLTVSGTPLSEADALGGVVDKLDDEGGVPRPVLLAESVSGLLASGSDEC